MNLAQALRFLGTGMTLRNPPRVAFVGAGGKTTLIFNLARQLLEEYPVVWVTMTTHVGTDQAGFADTHLRIDKLGNGFSMPLQGVILFTGVEVEAGRLGGLNEAGLDRLLRLADAHRLPLLIEADGSRRLPLKAPASHEPVIPAFVNMVAVTAGLSGLGKKLGAACVHRPERFAELAGLALGEEITAEALSRVLTHSMGGMKNIPPLATRVLLLNQADTLELRRQAKDIARRCMSAYQAVVVSGLDLPLTSSCEDERIQLLTPKVFSTYEPHAIIILAAGASRRFGSPKQLVEWHGQPLIRYLAQLALERGVQRVRVVIGAAAEQVQEALQGLPVDVVFNSDWQTGQASSLRCGLDGLPVEISGALFLLVDQPCLPPLLLDELLDLHAERLQPLTAPRFGTQRLNPVLFDRVTFPRLMALEGDVGGRALFAEYPEDQVAWLTWEQPELLQDFDTLEDLERLRLVRPQGTEIP